MGITFRKAPTVTPGEKLTSAQINTLAGAFNDRLRSGIGDATWRVWWKAYSIFGRFRPDAAVDEWFATFMLVEPEEGAPSGPLNDTANPMVMFPLGSGAVDDEGTRLDAVGVGESVALADIWALGKDQRGLVDPTTGGHNAPAFEASIAHKGLYSVDSVTALGQRVNGDWVNPFNKTYGGFRGVPGVEDCGGGVLRAVRVFTPLAGGSPVSYTTCGSSGAILQTLEYGPDEYLLHLYNGSTTRLSYKDWIEGPYLDDSYLSKHNVDVYSEALCRYVSGFRGADSERTGDGWDIEKIAFDFERFFGSQYLLAPAHAHTVLGSLVDDGYPQATGSDVAEGEYLDFGGGMGTTYEVDAGFTVAGIYLVRSETGAEDDVFLTMSYNVGLAGDPGTVLKTRRIRVPALKTELMMWFDEVAEGDVRFYNDDADTLSGDYTVELAVLEKYKPDLTDAYVVLRRGTTNPGVGACDTRGQLFGGAKERGDSYFANGCIMHSEDVSPLTDVNESPVYEATRVLMRDHLRLLKRHMLHSYAVESGVSVVYFRRYDEVTGTRIDLWKGIAPADVAIESGKVLSGVLYVVKGVGTLSYNGVDYTTGETFTGVEGAADFTITETAEAWQVEGIVAAAPAGGFSNEWSMFMETCGYGGAGYEYENLADAIAFMHNRCHAFAKALNGVSGDLEMAKHIGYGGELAVVAESPSGLNYVKGINGGDDGFYSSCQVYKPDYRAVSVRMDGALVRVEFDRRFQWSLGGERTDENALIDYLSGADCPLRVGDQAADPADATTHGACVPRFHFTKGVELVQEDDPPNETSELTDTPAFADRLQWMHWVLEAICDGYIDTGVVSTGGCVHAPQFTFNGLCFRAGFESQWLRLLPARIRAEQGKGFGPLPNMKLYREYFNSLATAINLLVRVPLDLPTDLEFRHRLTGGRVEAPVVDSNPGAGHTGQVMAVVGDPDVSLRPTVEDPYTWVGAYEEPWSVWGASIVDASKTAAQSSAIMHYAVNGGDGFFHYSGIDTVQYTAGFTCKDAFYPLTFTLGVPDAAPPPPPFYLLCHEVQVEMRLSQASHPHLAVSADILDLIDTSGLMLALVDESAWWATLGGSTTPSCPLPSGSSDWYDSGVKVLNHTYDARTCALLPISGDFIQGGGIPVDPLPCQPSVVWAMCGGSCLGTCGNLVATGRAVQAFGYTSFAVPLV